MDVVLTHSEVRAAALVGIERRLTAMKNDSREVYGKAANGLYWDIDVEAAGAELAVAKALGVFWSAKDTAAEDRAEGDVAGAQVRHTQRQNGSLICHDRDSDDQRFVLVTGTMPNLVVRGWILGAEAKDQKFWRTNVPRPAYFVPQSELHPL